MGAHDMELQLHQAARVGDAARITILAAAAKHSRAVQATDSLRRTPLHLAAENGHVEAIKELLAAGAYVDATCSNGWSPLHYAAFHGNTEAVRALLAAGADLALKTARRAGWFPRRRGGLSSMQTPLQLAVTRGHAETASVLGHAEGVAEAARSHAVVVALLEHQVAALRADGSRLRAEADGWAQAVKEAEQRVAELESRLKDAEAQAMRLRLDSHARRAQLAALSAEVALLRGQVEGMRRQRSAALSLAKPLVRRVLSKLLRRVRGGLLLGAAALALAVVATQARRPLRLLHQAGHRAAHTT